MKNKKGFTLIELLGVIVLITVILALAMVALSEISKKRKEQAWGEVKNEIEAAAKEYMTANEYYFSNNGGDKLFTKVYVGKLVEEDYLNKVINPENSMAVNKCDYIELAYDDDKVTSSNYIENPNETSCTYSSVTISEVPIEKIDDNIQVMCEYKDNSAEDDGDGVNHGSDWCYRKTFSSSEYILSWEDVNQLNSEDVNQSISEVKDTTEHDVLQKQVYVYDKNDYKKKATLSYEYGIDRTPPTFADVKTEKNSDNSDKPYKVTGRVTDDKSGVSYVTLSGEEISLEDSNKINYESESAYIGYIVAYDLVGNIASNPPAGSECVDVREETKTSECKNNIKTITKSYIDNTNNMECKNEVTYEDCTSGDAPKDTTPPSCGKVSVVNTPTKGNNGWYRSEIHLKIDVTDDTAKWYYEYSDNKNAKGEVSTRTKTFGLNADGKQRYIKYVVYDAAGNSQTCYTKKYNIDKTPPSILGFGGGRVTGCKNGIAWGYSIKYKDNLSGVYLSSGGYYSSSNCSKFYWAKSNVTDSVSGNNQKTTTVFANCSNNRNPSFKFNLVDGAGNRANEKIVTASGKKTKSSCRGDRWWNK